ncbi:MAG: SRPBCC domain-containing protein [Sediminibacterium sp.]
METANKTQITVESIINAPVEKVWKNWTDPKDIVQWAFASDDWHAPYADNDVRVDGTFKTTMAAKDGSFSFDFGGVYTKVEPNQTLEYTIGDGRRVWISFSGEGNTTKVVETFEAEDTHSIEMQKGGWEMIMNNFKKHTEAQ